MLGEISKEDCFLFQDVIKLKRNPKRAAICKLGGMEGEKVTEKELHKGA